MDRLPDPTIRTCELVNHNVTVQIVMYVLQLVYALPISLLYLFVILRILKKHRKEQAFADYYFRIYVLDGVVSVIVLILDFGLTRPLIYVNPLCYVFSSLFPEPTYWLTPYLFFFNYFQFAKIFSITLLSANRFTCVAYPIWHKTFWKKHTNRVIIVAILTPILFTWHLGISKTTFDYYDGEGILGYIKVVSFVRTTFFKLVVSSLAFLFILITNIKTFQLAKQFKNKMKSFEHSLTLSTIVISACFIIYIIVQAILLVFSTAFLLENLAFGSALKKFEFICNDFYLMSSPIALLILNKRLRKSIFQSKVTPEAPRNSSNKNSMNNFETVNNTVHIIVKSPSGKTVSSFGGF